MTWARGRLILSALLFASVAASAAPVDLYSAEAPVSGETAEARNVAVRSAFSKVLVKLTGDRLAETRTGYDNLLAAGPGLVQQYRYRLDESGAAGSTGRLLWVRFDPPAVDRLLAGNAWSVWRAPRPRLLLWLAKDEGGVRSLLNPEFAPELVAVLRGRAEQRGITLQMPLMDLEDQAQVTAADIWGSAEGTIRAASRRYGDGPILLGRLKFRGAGRWQPDWTILDAGRIQPLAAGTGILIDSLADGVDLAADWLASTYAPSVVTTGPAPVQVVISGVYALRDYAQVLEVMGKAAGTTRLSVRRAAGDLLVFDVWLDGDAAEFSQGLLQVSALQEQPVAPNGVGVQQLVYRWVP